MRAPVSWRLVVGAVAMLWLAASDAGPAVTSGALTIAIDSEALARDDSVVLRWRAGTLSPLPGSGRSVTGDRRWQVRLADCEPGDVYLIRAPFAITEPVERRTEQDCAETVRPQVFASAELQGTAVFPQMPRGSIVLPIETRSCHAGPERRAFPVLIEPSGAWRSWVPAGCLDLMIRNPGHVPVEIVGLTTRAGQTLAIAPFRFVPITKALVSVRRSADDMPLPGAELWLIRPGQDATVASQLLDGKTPGPATETSDGAGLAFLETTHRFGRVCGRWKALAPTCTTIVDLHTYGDKPLVLSLSDAVRVDVSVIRDGADGLLSAPGDLGYGVPCFGGECDSDATAKAVRAGDGRLTFPRLAKGLWVFRLAEGSGPSPSPVAAQQRVWLSDSEHAVVFDLRASSLTGTVTLAGRPQRCRLSFVALPPEWAGVEVSASSDANGEFTAVFPVQGAYRLTASWADSAGRTVMPRVEVAPGMEIRLPATVVRGVVTSHDGSTVAGATVAAQRPSVGTDVEGDGLIAVTARTDQRGQFEFSGLVPGEWKLRAESGAASSTVTTLALRDGDERVVKLAVSRSRTLTGRAVDALGRGIPGLRAFGFVEPAGADDIGVPVAFETDPDGWFRVSLGHVVGDYLNVMGEAPSMGAFASRCAIADVCQLVLPASSGPLRLRWVANNPRRFPNETLAVVSQDGGVCALAMLRTIEVISVGGEVWLEVPRLAAGAYDVVSFSAGVPAGTVLRQMRAGQYSIGSVVVEPLHGGTAVIAR